MLLPDYAATIAYLEDLTARPILPREHAGLERARTLLALAGHPEQRFATIHVAGTTGKGSTTTMAAAILQAAGRRTGAFTSPHLQTYRERIAIDGVPIDAVAWVRLLNELLPHLARMEANDLRGYNLGRAAFMEVLWTMACLAFVERGVVCAVVEAGLGGRLDPTAINAATVAVLTNVSLDHTERLGRTVEAIATEKAGLIKPGQIVVSAARDGAIAVIRETCEARDATLWRVDEDGEVLMQAESDEPEATIAIQTPVRSYTGLHLGLRGVHQRLNAACAVGGVEALVRQTGLVVPATAVVAGLVHAAIPGRMEQIAGRPAMLLDGAHNVAGAAALVTALATLYRGRRVVLVLGILGDKDIEHISALLSAQAAMTVVTEPPWERRAGFAERIAEFARGYCPWVEVAPSPAAALARARAVAGHDDLIVVAGSLYLVGAVRDSIYPLDESQG